MAVEFDNVVSEWSRNTAADGKWLNLNTIVPLIRRTETLRDAINDMGETDVPELERKINQEIVDRTAADTAEQEARNEADYNQEHSISELSSQLGDTITICEGEGIHIEEIDGGNQLKISVTHDIGDDTTYGFFGVSGNATFGTGGWSVTQSSGNLSTDGTDIIGLKDNKVYNVSVSARYIVNVPVNGVICAYLEDTTGKKLYFNVDLSIDNLETPISFSYDLIPSGQIDPTTQTYKFHFVQWTSDDPAATNIDADLILDNITIHEVASKSIGITMPEITQYGLKGNSAVTGPGTLVALPFDGTPMTGQISHSGTQIDLVSANKYLCNAMIEFKPTSTPGSGYEEITISVPYQSSNNMETTYYVSMEHTSTVNLSWQITSCTELKIILNNLPGGLTASAKYIQLTEIK